MSQQPYSKDDLRGQLSEIQKKLFSAKRVANTATSGPSDEKSTSRINPAPNVSMSSDSRRHMPPLGPRRPNVSTSNKVIPQPRPQLRPESKGQDMDFVVGLSENLLGQCRRLSAENQKLRAKLKSQSDEIAEVRTHVSTLSKSSTSAADHELELKDRNWELETSLAKLQEELDTLQAANGRLVKTHNETTLRVTTLQRDNDELQLRAVALDSEMRAVEDSYHRDLADLRERIDNLNDENDGLLLRMAEQQKDASAPEPAAPPLGDPSVPDLEPPTDLDQIIDEFGALAIQLPASDPSNKDLELETLRASVVHSSKTILRLTAALVKLKNVPPSRHSTPQRSKRMQHRCGSQSLSVPRCSVLSPTRRKSKFISVNVLDDDDEAHGPCAGKDDWERFFEPQLSPNTPSKPARRPFGSSRPVSRLLPNSAVPVSKLHDSDSSELDFESPRKACERVLSRELGYPTSEQVQQYAKEKGLMLLSLAEFAKLEYSNVEHMSMERLEAVVVAKGHVLLSQEEWTQITDEQEMERRLHARGLVTLPAPELDKLRSVLARFHLPELDYLTEKLDSAGYSAVTKDRLKSLERSQELFETPTETFLASKARNFGLCTVSEDEYTKLKRVEMDHAQPSREYLTDKANEMGLILVLLAMYDALQKQLDLPLVEYLRQNAQAAGYELLLCKEHSSFVEPTLDAVEARAGALGHVLVPLEEHEKLQAALSAPLLQYLQEKAHVQNFHLLSNAGHAELVNPDLERVTTRAQELSHVLVQKEAYDAVCARADRPDMDHLRAMVTLHDCAVVQNGELAKLQQLAYSPAIEHVKEMAKGHVVVADVEYAELARLAREPTAEEVLERAARRNMVVVDKNAHAVLSQAANEPLLEHLASKARALGYVAVSEEELRLLRHQLDAPTLEYLSAKAAAKSRMVVPENEYLTFQRVTGLSALEYLKEKAMLEDVVVVEKQTYNAMANTVSAPSVAYLQEKAAQHCRILLPVAEYEQPSRKYLVEKAAGHNMVVVEQTEYHELEERVQSPAMEYLREKAELLGHVVVLGSEHGALLAAANSPSLEHVQKKARALDHVTVLVSDYDAMTEAKVLLEETNETLQKEKVTLEKEKEMLEETKRTLESEKETLVLEKSSLKEEKTLLDEVKTSLEGVKSSLENEQKRLVEENEQLRHDIDTPSLEFLFQKAQNLGHAVLPEDHLQDLKRKTENPLKAEVEHWAEQRGTQLVNVDAYRQLVDAAATPSREKIVELAGQYGFVSVPQDELKQLREAASDESVERMKRLAHVHAHEVVLAAEFDALQRRADMPTVDELREHAMRLCHRVLPDEEHASLVALAHDPDLAHVRSVAAKLDHEVVGADAYAALQQQAHSPTLEQVHAMCAVHDCVAVLQDAYRELLTPDLERVKDLAAEHKHVCYAQEDAEDLKTLAHNPPVAHVTEMATRAKLVAVSVDAYRSLEQRADAPTLDQLQAHAQRNNLELIEVEELTRLRDTVARPDKDFLVLSLAAEGYVMVPSAEFEKSLEDKQKAENMKLIPKEQYELLRATRDAPSLEFITNKAQQHACVVVERDAYVQLVERYELPTRDLVTSLAEAMGLAVLELAQLDEFHQLRTKDANPLADDITAKAEKLGLAAVPVHELTDLRARVESPDLEFLLQHANRQGRVVVEQERMQQLNVIEVMHQNPSLEYVTANAAVLAHLVLPQERVTELEKIETEHARLQMQHAQPVLDYLQQKAAVHEHVLVAAVEYQQLEEMAQKHKQPPLEYLRQHAEEAAHVLVSQNAFENSERIAAAFALPLLDYLCSSLGAHNHTAVPDERHAELIAREQQWETPSREHVAERAAALGCVVVGTETLLALESARDAHDAPLLAYLHEKVVAHDHALIACDVLKQLEDTAALHHKPALEYVRTSAEHHNHVLVPREEYLQLVNALREHDAPTRAHVDAQAAKLGVLVVSAALLADLTAAKTAHDAPSSDYLTQHARDIGCELVESDTLRLLRQYCDTSLHDLAAAENSALVPCDELEALHARANQSLDNAAQDAGMVVVSAAEHASLTDTSAKHAQLSAQIELPDADFINALAAICDAVVVLRAEHDALRDPPFDALTRWADDRGCCLVQRDELAALKASVAEPLETRATRVGLVVVSVAEFNDMYQKTHEPTVRDLDAAAAQHDHRVVVRAELEQLQADAARLLAERAAEAEVALVPEIEYAEMVQREAALEAAKEEMNAFSEEMDTMRQEKDALVEERDVLREERDLLRGERDVLEGEKNALEGEKEALKSEKDASQTEKEAFEGEKDALMEERKTLNIEREALNTERDILRSERSALQTEKDAFQSERHALLTEKDALVFDKAMLQEKTEGDPSAMEAYFSRDASLADLASWLAPRGITVMSDAETDEDLRKRAHERGLVVLGPEEHSKVVASAVIPAPAAIATFREVATPPPTAPAESATAAPTLASVLELAALLSLAVVPASEITRLKQQLAERDSTIHALTVAHHTQTDDKDELLQRLRGLDMVALTRDEYQALEAPVKPVVTEDALRRDADALGLNIVSDSEFHDMKAARAALADPAQIRGHAKKLRMLCVSESALVDVADVSDVSDASQMRVVTATYLDQLQRKASAAADAENNDSKHNVDACQGAQNDRTALAAFDSPLERVASTGAETCASSSAATLERYHSAKAYDAESITAISIATNLSFTDKSMIPAITQVVIGEYLFKYYRRLGPLSAISAMRHERYFWVHPYSLTLYWSSSNPVLSNPSDVRTKAMAIVRVDGVEDTNPLPPGLHHRSIIVHSPTGSVKITCPTRQRHNIWLNALRYLVSRTGDTSAPSTFALGALDLSHAADSESSLKMDLDEPSRRHAFPRSASLSRTQSMGQFRSIRSARD